MRNRPRKNGIVCGIVRGIFANLVQVLVKDFEEGVGHIVRCKEGLCSLRHIAFDIAFGSPLLDGHTVHTEVGLSQNVLIEGHRQVGEFDELQVVANVVVAQTIPPLPDFRAGFGIASGIGRNEANFGKRFKGGDPFGAAV